VGMDHTEGVGTKQLGTAKQWLGVAGEQQCDVAATADRQTLKSVVSASSDVGRTSFRNCFSRFLLALV
jgi:hypothetical protein